MDMFIDFPLVGGIPLVTVVALHGLVCALVYSCYFPKWLSGIPSRSLPIPAAYIHIYIYVAGTFGVYFVPPDIHVLYMHLYKNINDLHAYKISAESCIFLSFNLRSVRFLIQKRL